MSSISPSLQRQLECLNADQRSQVGALLAALDESPTRATTSPRQPGGLLGKLRTHADFDAPLAEEFLIPSAAMASFLTPVCWQSHPAGC